MQITEVRVKLVAESGERLQGYCKITFDGCFVVRDVKIIAGPSGPFVAMPNRKLTSHCPKCGYKNQVRAAFCNQCGARIANSGTIKDDEGRDRLHADVAHPITASCREMIQKRVIEEFRLEQDRAKNPDYVSRYDDFDLDTDDASASPRPSPIQNRSGSSQRIPAPHAFRNGAVEQRAPADANKPSGRDSSSADANSGFGAGIL